jgi:hypothetical protein
MPHLSTYVALVDHSEKTLAESFRIVGHGHASVHDVFHMCETLAGMCDGRRDSLGPIVERFGESPDVEEPERLRAAGVEQTRDDQIGLLRDLQDLHLLATLVKTSWTVIAQGAQGLRDDELFALSQSAMSETTRQLVWLETRMKSAAPQALIVSPPRVREADSGGP